MSRAWGPAAQLATSTRGISAPTTPTPAVARSRPKPVASLRAAGLNHSPRTRTERLPRKSSRTCDAGLHPHLEAGPAAHGFATSTRGLSAPLTVCMPSTARTLKLFSRLARAQSVSVSRVLEDLRRGPRAPSAGCAAAGPCQAQPQLVAPQDLTGTLSAHALERAHYRGARVLSPPVASPRAPGGFPDLDVPAATNSDRPLAPSRCAPSRAPSPRVPTPSRTPCAALLPPPSPASTAPHGGIVKTFLVHFWPTAGPPVFSRDTTVSAKKSPNFKCKFHQILRHFLVPGVGTKP